MNEQPAKVTPECPSDAQLRHLLQGDMNEREQAALETHIEGCATCQTLVAGLCECPEAQTWWEAIRGREPLDGAATAFLERLKTCAPFAAPAIAFPGPATAEAPLGQLESYQVLQELGRGGMGVVFLARDTHLGHLVTLKVLKPELAANPADRERFFREGRAAAAVKHDHVVTVHRADVSSGFPLPYLVMEYVEGESLHDRLARRGALPPGDAALITCQAALGLAAAHGRGLVHRDVKPSNIMLEAETGRAKITDFGLARVLDAETDQLTQQGSMLGTPGYMSPEHMQDPARVDARSDVYSLGAVMYEMLTGVRVFAGTAHMVLLQTIHDDARPPSRLNDGVPRDLETICLKCLRKRPSDRYAAAEELAEDLRRFLRGEPIQARPVGHWEKFSLWRRRNPKIAALAFGILTLLVLITGISLTSAAIVRRSWKQEAAARAQADRRSTQARRAVDEMYTQVAEEWLADQPLMQPLQRRFLLKALGLYEEFAQETTADPEVRRQAAIACRRVGDIHYTLGEYQAADAAYLKSVGMQQDLVQRWNQPEDRKELAVTQLNRALLCATGSRTKEAQMAYGDAQELLEQLVAQHPAVPEYRDHLANCLSGLSQSLKASGETIQGVQCCHRAITLQQELVRQFPDEQRYPRNLATSLVHLGLAQEHAGKFEEARQALQKGLTVQNELLTRSPTRPGYRFDLANSYTHLSRLQRAGGLFTEARATLLQVKGLQEKLIAEFPSVPRYRTELGSTLSALASLLRDIGQLAESEACFRQAIQVYGQLASEFPDVPDHRMAVAGITNNLCGLLTRTGRTEEARVAYAELIAEQERLAAQFPADVGYQVALAISCNNFGNLLEHMARPDDAESILRRAVETYERLAAGHPDAIMLRQNLNGSISNLCRVLCGNGKPEEAEKTFERVIADQRQLASAHPNTPEYQSALAHTLNNLGTLSGDLGRHQEAEAAFREALEIRDSLATRHPEVAEFRRDVAASHNNLGVFYESIGQLDKAREPLECALRIREQLADEHADDVQYAIDLCGSYGNLGRYWLIVGNADTAIHWLDQSVLLTRQVLEKEPRQEEVRQTLRHALATRARAHDASDHQADALSDLDEALALTPDDAAKNRLCVQRARVLLHLGRYDDTVSQVETASQSPALTAAQAYDLACVLSLLSATMREKMDLSASGVSERVEGVQSRAVQLLEKSRVLGLFVQPGAAQRLDDDADLDALRTRDDFKKLRGELRAEGPS